MHSMQTRKNAQKLEEIQANSQFSTVSGWKLHKYRVAQKLKEISV